MTINTADRARFITLAARIADDLDTAAKLPREAVLGADRHTRDNGTTAVHPHPEDSPFRYPDRSAWPQAAAWLRNLDTVLDGLPDEATDPDEFVPACVWAIESYMIVDDSSVITWCTTAAIAEADGQRTPEHIGRDFMCALGQLAAGDSDGYRDDLSRMEAIVKRHADR